MPSRLEWCFLLGASLVGCDAPGGSAPVGSPGAPPSTPPSTKESGAPVLPASAAPVVVDTSLAGHWEGTLDAKKADVPMPEGVKDTVRSGDDPKANTGAGKVTLDVGPDSAVTGRIEGALGVGALSGQVLEATGEGGGRQLRASLTPDRPEGFSGILLLEQGKKGGLEGSLRASGPDAIRVREAALKLEKKR